MRVSVDQKPYLGSAAGLRDVRRDKRDGVSAGDEFTPLINTHIHTHTHTHTHTHVTVALLQTLVSCFSEY